MRDRSVPADDEVQLRQLPPEQHPGRHEADQGEGRHGAGVRTHAGGRQHVLRQRSGERSGAVQAGVPGHIGQPL